MTVFAGEHAGAAGPGNGIGHVTVCENEPFFSNFIDIRCGDTVSIAVSADRLPCMVIRHDIDDVERFSVFNTLFLSGAGSEEEAGGECCKCAIG